MINNPIELIALISVIAVLVKILVILISPKAWGNFTKKLWKKPVLLTFISLALAILVLTYLLESVNIIQIFAVMIFVSLLSVASIASYSDEMMKLANKILKDRKFLRKAWVSILIWVGLAIWGLIELLKV